VIAPKFKLGSAQNEDMSANGAGEKPSQGGEGH